MTASRREFFKAAAGLAAAAARPGGLAFDPRFGLSLAGLGALAATSAQAADTSGYKALVCLYMSGGNDSHNWIVPMDSASHAQYSQVRRELAIPLNRLQPITVTNQGSGRAFGMPLELAPLRALYEAGRCAAVANVGTLDRPITKADFDAGRLLPKKLFSHNDQASTWQALGTEGAPSGWGGRMGDVLMSANQHPVFTAVSAGGNAVFLAGSQVTQYQLGANGPVGAPVLDNGWLHGSPTASAALRRVASDGSSSPFAGEYARVMKRSMDSHALLTRAMANAQVAALPTAPISVGNGINFSLANDSLARQLRLVAQMVAAAPQLGARRQVFMVQLSGFDCHNHQMRDQPLQMARVAHGVQWFMQSLAALGLQNNVTLFTASEFGRTLVNNGDGSDHGWGSHHFVVGGAVKGRQIHGRMPVTVLGTADDVGSGRLLPSTSVTQLASSLAAWMGLNAAEQRYALPNLGNFNRMSLALLG